MFWKFWTTMMFIVGVLAGGQYLYDIFGYLIERDVTYISFVIMTIFTLCMVKIGWMNWNLSAGRGFARYETERLWYIAEAMMGLGMLGTLSGFLIVLSSAFTDIDVTNVEEMKAVIGTLSTGMGTALLTSMVGLIASMTTKHQLVVLETNNEKV